jgi:hypothetical protein
MEFRQESGVGTVSVPNIVTCLSPWGQTGAIPSRLALFARPAPPAHGLDRMSPARRRLGKRLRLGENITFPSQRLRRALPKGPTKAYSRPTALREAIQ